MMTSQKKQKMSLKRISIIIITILFTFSLVSMAVTKIIYDSLFTRYDETTPVPAALEQLVQGREQLQYPCGEHLLTGYLYRTAAQEDLDTLVVLVPGFHASVDDYLWQIQSLTELGWSVFAFDTTGSCTSQGDSAVGFPQILTDLDETLKYVEKNGRFGYNELVLFGHSRGGYAVCCALAYDYDVAAVVSVSAINSAMEGVVGSATEYVGPLAYANYGFLWIYQAMLFGSRTLNMSADDEITDSHVPVLIVHGVNDETVPMEQYSVISHRDEIASAQVEYIVCTTPQQDGHTDLLFDSDGSANSQLMAQIHTFLLKNIDDRS